MSAATEAIRTAEDCRESARILDDARKGMVLGGQLPERWPKRKMKTQDDTTRTQRRHPMTDADTKRRQEHFNIVWQRFVVEGAPPSWDGTTCLYREGPDGHTCAFGALLTEGERAGSIEGVEAVGVIEGLGLSRFYDSAGNADAFYDDLQCCHDENAHESDFTHHVRYSLRNLAAEFDLTVPEATP